MDGNSTSTATIGNKLTTVYEDDLVSVKEEEVGGYVFLHLDFKKASKSSIKFCRDNFAKLLELYSSKGHEVVSFCLADETKLKLFKFIKEPDFTKRIKHPNEEEYYIVGGWWTEDD